MNPKEKTYKEIFCGRLLDLRHKMRLSQENMADMLGISASKYAKLEEGKTRVYLGIMELMCKTFKMDILYFLGRDGFQ